MIFCNLSGKLWLIFFLFFFCPPLFAAKPNVIIVGAGVAGLSAASELHHHGYPVLVLEARARLGGRIYSIEHNGASFELGASWIHGILRNPLVKIAHASGINTQTTIASSNRESNFMNSLSLHDFNGKSLTYKKIISLKNELDLFFDYVEKNSAQQKSYQVLMDKFAKKQSISRENLRYFHYLVHSAVTYEYAADLKKLSTLPYFSQDFGGDDVLMLNRYQRLIEKLSKGISIATNEEVKTIRYDRKGVTIITQDHTYHAKYAIITLPLGVLKSHRVQFIPSLSKRKEKAIEYFIARWEKEPFSRGSYSYLPADVATNRKHSATVHGAYLSGERAAKEIEALP